MCLLVRPAPNWTGLKGSFLHLNWSSECRYQSNLVRAFRGRVARYPGFTSRST